MPNSNLSSTLLTAAEVYSALGWSVIPLLGDRDPARPKVPAIPWAVFQNRKASLNEQSQWSEFGGLGIVTGRVSQLVVLDFDAHNVIENFKKQLPDLLETRTILSAGRKLPHLYFKLPSHLYIESRKGQGIDLLSDGRYVVAPPTSINGETYKIVRGGMPRALTERDIRRLQAFFSTLKADDSRTPQIALKNPLSTLKTRIEPYKPSVNDLLRCYQHHCKDGGRNDALFQTALFARDTGWTQDEFHNVITHTHIYQPSKGTHRPEAAKQRQKEARATIRSAYSRPAQPLKQYKDRPQGALSNSVREKLIQQKRTYVVRTYEGLIHAGIQPGQECAVKSAIEQLTGLVGRDSVIAALKAKEEGKPLFPPLPPRYAIAIDPNPIESKECSFEEKNNQEKVPMGRPQHRFRMPSNAELCALLGVKETSSDLLVHEDLASAQKTRMAVHRELIKRRPGSYPCDWLARRLGVSKTTLRAYNRLIPIHSHAMFVETRITWKTIERLPFDEPIQGAVLVTLKGKRYPALRTVASRLLAAGQGITLKQRAANFFWYGNEEPILARLQIQQEIEVKQEQQEAFVAKQPIFHNVIEQRPLPTSSIVKPIVQHPHRPLKDEAQEAQAQHLYQTMSQFSRKRLSLANSRRLVAIYGTAAIENAMQVVGRRQNITNVAGLLVTYLRSSTRP